MKQRHKILIISLSGLGDLILFTPCFSLLRERFPEAEISLLVKQNSAQELVEDCPFLDKIIVFDPQRATLRELYQFYSRMRREKYEASISTFPALSFLNNLSTWAIAAKERWVYKTGYPLSSFDFLQNRGILYVHGKHRLEYNFEIVKAFNNDLEADIVISSDRVRLWLKEDGRTSSELFGTLGMNEKTLFVAIHAGSGDNQPFKRWNPGKFALLADRIQQKSPFRVILIGGPTEEALCQKISREMITSAIVAAGKMKLRDTIEVLKRSQLLISNDSGVMNMAVAVKTPVVAIFGPTDETCTKPLGWHDVCLVQPLPCKPKCRQDFLFQKKCPFNYQCLDLISVEEVWRATESILKSIEGERTFPI
ncbi:MAG: glycosyltransferase family 9 protein [bacterium]